MLEKIPCKYCGCKEETMKLVPPHIGAYCAKCGKWKFWVPKKAVFQNNNVAFDEANRVKEETKSEESNDTYDDDGEVPW